MDNSADSPFGNRSPYSNTNVNQRNVEPQTPQSLHQSQTNSPIQNYTNQQQQQQSTISISSNNKEMVPKRVNELKREGLLKRTPKENWKWAVKRINSKAKNVSIK